MGRRQGERAWKGGSSPTPGRSGVAMQLNSRATIFPHEVVLLGGEKFDLDRAGWEAFEVVVRSHQRRALAQRQRPRKGIDKWNLEVILKMAAPSASVQSG